jgi:hypothetical protein
MQGEADKAVAVARSMGQRVAEELRKAGAAGAGAAGGRGIGGKSAAEAAAEKAERAAEREAKAAERLARTKVREEQQASREIQRINAQTARQAEQQEKLRERSAKTLADVQIRESRRAATEMLRSMRDVERGNHQIAVQSGISWSTLFGVTFFANLGARAVSALIGELKELPGKAAGLAADTQNALKGLGTEAVFRGFSESEAQKAVQNLRLVRGGVVSITDASTALKNLLATGFGLKEATVLLERFSDASAFGKQSALSHGEAIRSASEGIKNQNSILVDNVGITKNLSVILRERGFIIQDLSDKVKGASAREALYQGLLAESAGQVGNADKLMSGYTGTIAAQDMAYQNLYRAIGNIIITNPALIESTKIVTEQINEQTASITDAESETSRFATSAINQFARIKAELIPFVALVYNAAKAVGHGMMAVASAFIATLTRMIEVAVNSLQAMATAVANLFIGAVNTITGALAKLPALPDFVPGAEAFNAVRGIPEIPKVSFQATAFLGSDTHLKLFDQSIQGVTSSLQKMQKISEESAESDRRILKATEFAPTARKYDKAIRDAEAKEAVARATALAEAAGEAADGAGGKKKGKKDKPEFDSDQMRIAKRIVEEGVRMGAQEKQILSALAAALVESNVKNLPYGDRDSLGVFQQRPSQGWGTREQIMSVDYAVRKYFEEAMRVDQSGTPGQLAQRVQRSAFPRKYDQRMGQAQRLFGLVLGDSGIDERDLEAGREAQRKRLLEQARARDAAQPAMTVATTSDQLQPIIRLTDAQKARQKIDEDYLGPGGKFEQLIVRRENLVKEVEDVWRDAILERGHREMDLIVDTERAEARLANLRAENADDQLVAQRRLLKAKQEQGDLEQHISDLQDELANGPMNQALRVQAALLEDIVSLRRREEEAIIETNRAQLELADATVYHADQANASVARFLAGQKNITEIVADAKIGIVQTTFGLIDSALDRFTKKLGIVGDLIKDIIGSLLKLALSKVFQSLFGLGGGGGIFGGGGGGGVLGGAGGGGIFGGPGIGFPGGIPGLGGILAAATGGGSSPLGIPAALSSQQIQAGLASAHAYGPMGPGGVGGSLAGGGLRASIAGALPLLGLGLGAGLVGGGQGLSAVVGGAGGLLAGGIGAAFLAPSIFGTSAFATSTLLPFLTNPFTIAAAGALLVGAFFLNRDKKRKAAEKQRNKLGTDALAQLQTILTRVNSYGSDHMDGETAIAAAMQVREQYIQGVQALQDGKARRHGMQDVARLDTVIAQIRAAAGRRDKEDAEAARVREKLTPAFARGGPTNRTDFLYNPRGYVRGPGTSQSDSILTYFPHTNQWARLSDTEFVIDAETTRNVTVERLQRMVETKGRELASGGPLVPQPSLDSRLQGLQFGVTVNNYGDYTEAVLEVLDSETGQKKIVDAVSSPEGKKKFASVYRERKQNREIV